MPGLHECGEAVVGRTDTLIDPGQMAVTALPGRMQDAGGHPGLAADILKGRRHPVFVAGETRHRETFGEDDKLRPRDFAIDALQCAFCTRLANYKAVGAADTQVDLADLQRSLLATKPALEMLRLGHRFEHKVTRRLEHPRHDDFEL